MSPRDRRVRRRPTSVSPDDTTPITKRPRERPRGRFCPCSTSDANGPADTPGSVVGGRRRTAISLGEALPHPSSGLPGASASNLIGTCLTLLRARFTQQARSLGPLVVSYTTVSPLPRSSKRPWRSALCCTFSRITPGGCYPPPCSVEPGRSSARPRPPRERMRDATVWPTRSRSPGYRPDSAVRTRIAFDSGHSSTSSGAAARTTPRSVAVRATPLATETPPRRCEAPMP